MTIESKTHVLVIATTADPAVDEVIRIAFELGARVTRVNTNEMPFSVGIRNSIDAVESNVAFAFPELASLDGVDSVWYRRIRTPECPPDMEPGVFDFCMRETRAALIGSLLSSKARFMSRPESIWMAEYKPFQLATAAAVGLVIPETVITNVPNAARDAFRHFGGNAIAKPCRTGYLERDGQPITIYTSLLSEDMLQDDAVVPSPMIIQPLIKKACDLRITVVGNKVFGAAIDSQDVAAASIDWRRSSHLPHHRPYPVPLPLRNAIMLFMERLGLVFGALDFVLTPSGQHVFLEINPNGQWMWLDQIMDLGISRAVAEWLVDTEG